ncbi:MAG: hypothetical protein JXA90_04640 [Planctomycetes bacterium]|nr:hypothetical protein [Planctomycetota bacterium]
MTSKVLRTSLGAAFWIAAVSWIVSVVRSEPGALRDMARFVDRDTLSIELRFNRPVLLEVGDALFIDGFEGRPAGQIAAIVDAEGRPSPHLAAWTRRASVQIFDRSWAGLRDDASATLVQVPEMAFGWARDTLIPPEKLDLVRREWEAAWRMHREEILALVRPLVRELIGEAQAAAEEEFQRFLERHRDEIQQVLRKVETEFDRERLSELFEREVWPIVSEHVEPVTDDIGREIWDRFPLWGLSWRIAFQSLPLTRDDYFERRWKRFIDEEVIPILKSHSEELFGLSREIARETLANPRVAAAAHDAIIVLLGDPDLHRLAEVLVREVFIENPGFRESMRRWWESPRVRRARRIVSERFETTVRGIGDILLGTREEGITPEFTRLLRAQILQKDRRRVILRPGTPGRPLLESGALLDVEIVEEGR